LGGVDFERPRSEPCGQGFRAQKASECLRCGNLTDWPPAHRALASLIREPTAHVPHAAEEVLGRRRQLKHHNVSPTCVGAFDRPFAAVWRKPVGPTPFRRKQVSRPTSIDDRSKQVSVRPFSVDQCCAGPVKKRAKLRCRRRAWPSSAADRPGEAASYFSAARVVAGCGYTVLRLAKRARLPLGLPERESVHRVYARALRSCQR